ACFVPGGGVSLRTSDMKKPAKKKAAAVKKRNIKQAKETRKAKVLDLTAEKVSEVSTPTFKVVPMVGDKELLKLACEFDLGPEPILNGRYKWWEKYPKDARSHHIYVKNMGHPDGGPDRWGIFKEGNSSCLNK